VGAVDASASLRAHGVWMPPHRQWVTLRPMVHPPAWGQQASRDWSPRPHACRIGSRWLGHERRRAVLQLDQNRAPIVGDARLVQVALWINDDREAVGPVGEASDIDVLAGQLIAVAVAPAHRHALHTV